MLEEENKLVGNTNDDWGGNSRQKITSRYIFCIGSMAISWLSIKQKITALSLAGAESILAASTTREGIYWMRRILNVLQHAKDCLLLSSVTISQQLS